VPLTACFLTVAATPRSESTLDTGQRGRLTGLTRDLSVRPVGCRKPPPDPWW
jgi:hypothetical protein